MGRQLTDNADKEPVAGHDSPIDDIILKAVRPNWIKVAMLVGSVAKDCERQSLPASYEAIADRIAALVEQRRIEAAGDLSNWRYGEVRLQGRTLSD